MLVREGDRIYLEARAKAEPADNVLTRDYYTLRPETPTEVTLDGNDVAKLVECALRHPSPNMRYGVLAAIWNHPESFRQIFGSVSTHPSAFQKYARSRRRSLISPR